MTYVKAIAGVTNSVETAIEYDSTAQTATFTCKGTTLSYSCELNGDKNPVNPLPFSGYE